MLFFRRLFFFDVKKGYWHQTNFFAETDFAVEVGQLADRILFTAACAFLPTAYVVQGKVYVLTRVWPSIHLSVYRGRGDTPPSRGATPRPVPVRGWVPQADPDGGGYPGQVQQGVPQPGPMGSNPPGQGWVTPW